MQHNLPKLIEDFDRERLGRLLVQFSSAVKRVRDKRLADDLREELLSCVKPPGLRPGTILRLAKWCKTDGIYADAMIIAKEILAGK